MIGNRALRKLAGVAAALGDVSGRGELMLRERFLIVVTRRVAASGPMPAPETGLTIATIRMTSTDLEIDRA